MRFQQSNFRLLPSRILLHAFFWIVILCYFTIGYTRNGDYKTEFLRSVVFLPNHMFLAYTFFYLLIPKFLFPKKFFLFFLFSVTTYIVSMQFSWFLNTTILGYNRTYWSLGASLLGQSTVLGIAISIKLLRYWYNQKQQIAEAQKQKITAELELLKSQVHPHFLFNTLNNLYSYTLHQSPKAPEIVLKLSNLLRFMIYESNAEKIPLKKEIALLQQYIELEQLRYGERLDISISISGDLSEKEIAPLLLLPLVENAFKHGASNQVEQSWISFDIHITGDEMKFKLVNSKDKELKQEEKTTGGIGLGNVKKRLELLYPAKYKLDISEDVDVFVVSLQLQLAEKIKTETGSATPLIKQNNANKMLIGG